MVQLFLYRIVYETANFKAFVRFSIDTQLGIYDC